MIARYTRPEMGKIWSDANKYRLWWQVEREVCRVQAERGLIPAEALATIETKAAWDEARILEIEATVKHDVIAFLTNLAESIGPASRFIHQGMTSSDLLDTALALQLKEAGQLLWNQLQSLTRLLTAKARIYRQTLMIGRTHGVHAEPITFGLKLLLWREELRRHQRRLTLALEDVAVGKISGAVGTYQHLDREVEQQVCDRLGLQPAPVSNQIVQRDRHAFFVNVLALVGATLEKIATEVRHLQRTEVLEAEEYFSRGQKGSSAMPHKRNPVNAERICGLARLLRGYAVTSYENIALWHERDISHSSAERVILPDACIILDFMLSECHRLIENLIVYPERMRRNLELTGGLIFSQEVLLKLIEKGVTREEAYQLVQKHALKAWETGSSFTTLLLNDPEITRIIPAEEMETLFNYDKVLKSIQPIFAQLLEKEEDETA